MYVYFYGPPTLPLIKNSNFCIIKANCFFLDIVDCQQDWKEESGTQRVSAFLRVQRL